MIYLITGQPGNGKTLYALATIEKRRKEEGRTVFQNGIPDLNLPWTPLEDPKKWNELPEGSIIVIDECQKTFPPRSSSSVPPPHVQPFETHRHKGYDIYLLTQDPSLVDNHIKKLAGRHYHVQRYFGMARATVFEMQMALSPITNGGLQNAVRHNFPYPKEVFGWYKSAEVHTHKRTLPKKVIMIPILLLTLIGLLYWTYYVLGVKKHPMPGQAGPSESRTGDQLGGMGQPQRKLTVSEYVAAYAPRIPDLPHTAAAYDEITRPLDAPYPAVCINDGSGCRCFSQQMTRLVMTDQTCANLFNFGFFRAWRSNGDDAPEHQMVSRGEMR